MKFKTLLLFASLVAGLNSCMFTEELYIKNDGSGQYSFKMDMSEMMESMKDMSNRDSLKEPEVLDTIILFKDLLEEKKDSIKKLNDYEKASLEAIQDLKLHMQVDESKGKMLLDFGLDFEKVSDLKNMQEKISKAQALNENKKENNDLKSKADVDYSFDGKTFKRRVVMKDLSEEKLQEVEKSIKQSGSFLDGSIYKIVYHFESKIKSVTFKDAQISEDKKTMTIEVPLDSVMKNPTWLDFEVKLKK